MVATGPLQANASTLKRGPKIFNLAHSHWFETSEVRIYCIQIAHQDNFLYLLSSNCFTANVDSIACTPVDKDAGLGWR